MKTKAHIFKFNKEKLDFERTNMLVECRTVVFILLCAITFMSFNSLKKEYVKTEVVLKEKDYKKTVFQMVDNLPFKYKDIVKAQALLESGCFKSPVFKQNNNTFGMRLATTRLSTATGDDLNHATYKTVEDCVIDRLLYETKYLHSLSREDYLKYLDRVYAEAGGYDKILEKVIRQNNL